MPVNSEHPSYTKRKDQWIRCRDAVEGSDAIKKAGTKYLPSLEDMEEYEYNAYKGRALFYGATGRTVQGLLGAIFRKQAHQKFPDRYKELIEFTTQNGMDLDRTVAKISKEVIGTGRVGILLDVHGDNEKRAYASLYSADTIINWEYKKIDNKKTLSMVVLQERYKTNPKDEFDHESKVQYRVLRLLEGNNGKHFYQQDVYRKDDGARDNDWLPVADMRVIPTRASLPLDRIPFIFVNPYDLDGDTDKPLLLDLVDANISHYITTADLEHGAHYTALPTPWVAGFPADTKLKIGSSIAWVSEKTDAKAYFLEFSGAGLGFLENRLRSKEQYMAVLGARLLENTKAGVEAADTVRLRASGDSGSLTAVSKNLSEAVETMLRIMVWWSMGDAVMKEIEYQLNTDFIDSRLGPQELTALVQAFQGGSISQDTFLFNLKRGELLPDGRTVEDEKALLDMGNGPTEPSMRKPPVLVPVKSPEQPSSQS